ncbi:MAG: hypothetical protein E6I98_00970 [Chloroflexi bacterium]|nr:MAG: hypothetical protein E6I98_00970 [Chloroflexota bacterium]
MLAATRTHLHLQEHQHVCGLRHRKRRRLRVHRRFSAFVNFNPTSSDFPIFNGTALFGTKLDTASVNGSAPMFDINTGLQAFTSNVNVVWTGFGPTTTFIDSFHVRTTGVLFIAHSNSTSRGAEASGTITDIAGNNDASVPTLNAQLQNATQGSISISKS